MTEANHHVRKLPRSRVRRINVSGHTSTSVEASGNPQFTLEDYLIVITYIEDPLNFSSLFGDSRKTVVGGQILNKKMAFSLFANHVNLMHKWGRPMHLTGRQMLERFQRYKRKYTEAKAWERGGLTEDDIHSGFTSIQEKQEDHCPFYERMDKLFGSKPSDSPPPDAFDSSTTRLTSAQADALVVGLLKDPTLSNNNHSDFINDKSMGDIIVGAGDFSGEQGPTDRQTDGLSETGSCLSQGRVSNQQRENAYHRESTTDSGSDDEVPWPDSDHGDEEDEVTGETPSKNEIINLTGNNSNVERSARQPNGQQEAITKVKTKNKRIHSEIDPLAMMSRSKNVRTSEVRNEGMSQLFLELNQLKYDYLKRSTDKKLEWEREKFAMEMRRNQESRAQKQAETESRKSLLLQWISEGVSIDEVERRIKVIYP